MRLIWLSAWCLLFSACSSGVDKATDAWTSDWTLLCTWGEHGTVSRNFQKSWHKGEVLPGKEDNRPYYDPTTPHRGILALHPLSASEPARLRFKGAFRFDQPVLVVVAGGNVSGDCVLECRVNEDKAGECVLDGKGWTTARFDLTGKVNGRDDLQLWITGGGAEAWHFEHAFIDEIRFEQKP